MKVTVDTQVPSPIALLYYCAFGDYVEVLNAPEDVQEFVGKICAWTGLNDLVPLEHPRTARHLSVEQTKEVQVRKLSPGEKITITIKGE